MTATQSFRIYELLNAQFQQPERARELTEAIEAVVNERIAEGNKSYEVLIHKDLEILRADIIGTLRAEIRDQKSEILKWLVGLFIPLYLTIVGLIITLLLRH